MLEEMAKQGVYGEECYLSQSHQLIGVRRLGRMDIGQARPSLLNFRNKQERDNLLELAPRLYKAKEEYWR